MNCQKLKPYNRWTTLLRPGHRGKDFSLHSHFTQHITKITTRFLINHVWASNVLWALHVFQLRTSLWMSECLTSKSHQYFILIWIFILFYYYSPVDPPSPYSKISPQPLSWTWTTLVCPPQVVMKCLFPFSIFISQTSIHTWIDLEANQAMMMAIELIESWVHD